MGNEDFKYPDWEKVLGLDIYTSPQRTAAPSPKIKSERCRHVGDEVMKAANAALPALMLRIPSNQMIDVRQLALDAIAVGSTLVVGFIEKKLI